MFKNWHFRSFRSRIIFFVVSLLVVLQAVIFFAVNRANLMNAQRHVNEALQVTADLLDNMLLEKRENLLDKVRALSSDYAFKPVANTNEHQTVLSALSSYQARANADLMVLLSMESSIIADTHFPSLYRKPFYLPELIEKAMQDEYGEAAQIAIVDGHVYQLVAVPLFSPEPSHWIIMGFMIDDAFARQLKENTRTEVSIAAFTQQGVEIYASTLPAQLLQKASALLATKALNRHQGIPVVYNGDSFLTLVSTLPATTKIGVILQRSLDEALAPYLRLRWIFAAVFAAGLVGSVIGSIFIARKVSHPVTRLADVAKEIEQGNFDVRIHIPQQDEFGELSERFNSMAKGLADRLRIKNVLGKVVSPAIADELLSRGIELGGEERQVTVLFSDIRNFTRMCEASTPKEILTLLNDYLSCVSDIIDEHHGVVDKYIGDAVMALFGAPLIREQDASNAVHAALQMSAAVESFNHLLAEKGRPPIGIGIGINTGKVIAGNMGSTHRLNYTVIGDGVNLASRLEGLTKFYGVPVLVSEFTAAQAQQHLYREIDLVRVKGKNEPIHLFQPLVREPTNYEEEALFKEVLQAYRQQDWSHALHLLTRLQKIRPEFLLYQRYLQRVKEFMQQPPAQNWDGSFTFSHK